MRNALCRVKASIFALIGVTIMSTSDAKAETIALQGNQSRKVSEHISVNLEFFGAPFVSFNAAPNPQNRGLDDLFGFKQVKVYDAGRTWTITLESTQKQPTRVRTTHGCEAGSRVSACVFRIDSVASAAPPLTPFSKEFQIPPSQREFQKLSERPLLLLCSRGKALVTVSPAGGATLQPWLPEKSTRTLGPVTLSVQGDDPKTIKMELSNKPTAPILLEYVPE